MKYPKDLSGLKFNKLTVLAFYEPSRNEPHKQWICKCDCGKLTIVQRSAILNGQVKSCGCLRTENCKRLGELNKEYWSTHQYDFNKSSNIPNNTTGIRGISYDKYNKLYNIRIRYSGKSYRKTAKTLDEAKLRLEELKKELNII